MSDFDVVKFSPAKKELTELAKKYSNLKIDGVNDKAGYIIVDEARKDLARHRIAVTKMGLAMREKANAYNKQVLAEEKEILACFTETEEKLKAEIERIKKEKLMEDMKVLLPERRKKLSAIEVKISDEEILEMSPDDFDEFYREKNIIFLEEKERRRKEEERIAEQNRLIAKAREEATIKAKQEADKRVEEAVAKAKVEARKEVRAEVMREAEGEIKKVSAVVEKSGKVAQAVPEAGKMKVNDDSFIKFLAEHGCTAKTKDEFYVVSFGTNKVLYKKIATFKA